MNTPSSIQIRVATEQDVAAMHALMFELAVFEKEPEAVETTVEEYLNDFRNGLFEGLVAEADGQVIGMTLYFMAYSSWKGKMLYLDDFVVNEAWRGKGVGQLLYDAFIAEARRRGCRLAKWQVLDWNEPAVQFYRKNEAEIETGWWNVKKFLDQ